MRKIISCFQTLQKVGAVLNTQPVTWDKPSTYLISLISITLSSKTDFGIKFQVVAQMFQSFIK